MPLMSSIVTRWPVLVSLPVTGKDRDVDGHLTGACVERIFGLVLDVYLGTCRTLEGVAVDAAAPTLVPGPAPVAVGEASVSASVIEVFEDRFTVHVRIRPAEGDGIAAEARGEVFPAGGVTRKIRDELIVHAQEARHYH